MSPAEEVDPGLVQSSEQPGSLVKVVALKARAELNGDLGTLKQFDEKTERWQVQLNDGSVKLLLPENLDLAEAGKDVQCEGLQSLRFNGSALLASPHEKQLSKHIKCYKG